MKAFMAAASVRYPHDTANCEELSKNQNMIFSDSLKELKNLSKQLFSAAEYFELSYTGSDQEQTMVTTLKDYCIKALVNTVDHLGSATYKVNDLLGARINEVSVTELCLSCIDQRLKTCRDYINLEGVSQQSLLIKTPKYHKRYILPTGETVDGAIPANSENHGCILGNADGWHQFANAIQATTKETPPPSISESSTPSDSPKHSQQLEDFSSSCNTPDNDLKKGTASPIRFPLLRLGSFSLKSETPMSSRPITPTRSSPRNPNPCMEEQMCISEPLKSSPVHISFGKGSPKHGRQNSNKGISLLKSLLGRHKPKKDDTLYTYLDEY